MADSRHFRAEGFGDLHGECADAARGAVDQDLLPRLDLPLVAQTLQHGQPGDWDGRACSNVTLAGFGAMPRCSRIVTYSAKDPPLPPYTSSPGLNSLTFAPPSTTPAKSTLLLLGLLVCAARLLSARGAADTVPVQDVQGSCMGANQHFIVRRDRLINFLKFEDIRRTIL